MYKVKKLNNILWRTALDFCGCPVVSDNKLQLESVWDDQEITVQSSIPWLKPFF